MKKILILANNDVGLYKFRKELLEALLKEYEVHIALPDGEFVEKLTEMGCVFHLTEMSRHGTNPFQDLALMRRYKAIIRKVAPQMVLTYTIKPNVYGGMVCAAKKIPYIPNITGLGTAVENKGVLQTVTTVLYRFGLRKASHVFFQNLDNLAFMKQKKIVKDNTDLLPGSGVNVSQYLPLPYPATDTVDFVFIARVMKEKGIDQYLDAAAVISKQYPQTRFHICGICEEEYQSLLEEKTKAGQITYHGLVGDMLPIYQMAACTVHPTYYPEGMSNVLLESCASGRPIITTDRAGCKEIVDDGVNGYVCRQQDSEDLIQKIQRFLALSHDERRQMGLNGRQKVEQEFDRNIVVEKYLAAIRRFSKSAKRNQGI